MFRRSRPARGAFRPIVTRRAAGCDGREARNDEARDAYGEIVRSRSPDAGIKFADDDPQATAARKPGTPRRPRISRNTIARGMPVVPAALLLLACAKCTRSLHAR